MIRIHYITKRGAHITKAVQSAFALGEEIKHLFSRRIAAHAKDSSGETCAAVFKLDGRWNYYFDAQAR